MSRATAPQDYATVFTNAKAGMDKVDKERVKQVVYEMSKDSPHFMEERRKQARTYMLHAVCSDRRAHVLCDECSCLV